MTKSKRIKIFNRKLKLFISNLASTLNFFAVQASICLPSEASIDKYFLVPWAIKGKFWNKIDDKKIFLICNK